MRYVIGIMAIFIAASAIAQASRITAECNQLIRQQLRWGAKIEQILEQETVSEMSDADWTECRSAALVYIEEARRKAEEKRAQREAEKKKKKSQIGEFVPI